MHESQVIIQWHNLFIFLLKIYIFRCDPLITYIEKKPFLPENVVNYMRQSECTYDDPNNDYSDSEDNRVCCPIFHRITGEIAGEKE